MNTTTIASVGKNIGMALLHGIIGFLSVYGYALIAGIPANIGTMTVTGVATGILGFIIHSTATPAGSTVQKPV